jgi:hypothetical protein
MTDGHISLEPQANLPPCIYCGSNTPPRHRREHVIPQSFGRFEPDNMLLTCVCDSCNMNFGDTIELILGRDTNEAIRRVTYGLKPPKEARDLMNRRVTLTIEEAGPWKGARAFIERTLNGDEVELLPFAQAGFRRRLEIDFTWIREADLHEANVQPYRPSGTEVRVVGPSREDIFRVCAKLKEFGFPTSEDSYREAAIGTGQRGVTFSAEATFDLMVQRAIAKIAFNYAAYVLGCEFMRQDCFGPTRRFIRYNEPAGYQVTTPIVKSILFDDHPSQRRTRAHLLLIEWDRSGYVLQSRVRLFNQITYVVRLCSTYPGLWWDVDIGHHFDPFTRKINQMTNLRLIRP